MSAAQIQIVTYVRASAERVWDALTNPDVTERYWMGTRMESDWRVGSSGLKTLLETGEPLPPLDFPP